MSTLFYYKIAYLLSILAIISKKIYLEVSIARMRKQYNYQMKQIDEICRRYNIALCYIFGSQQNNGKAILEGKKVEISVKLIENRLGFINKSVAKLKILFRYSKM